MRSVDQLSCMLLTVLILAWHAAIGIARVADDDTTLRQPHQTIELGLIPQGNGLESKDTFDDHNRIVFSCPSTIEQAANADENQEEWYDAISAGIAKNVTEFLRDFRDTPEYDNWGHSYEQVKEKYATFKTQYFAPNLFNGMSIYESASGLGLNLLMTLELLEQENLEGIVVYGNEYVKDSVEISRQVLGSQILPGNAKLGQICQADSSDLQHVPSDSFDLVYTGYITPLMNPLNLDVDRHEIYTVYADLCGTSKEEEEEEEEEEDIAERAEENSILSRRAQELQDAWYRAWIAEMIRIAKPGAPVIVEQVSYPKCQNYQDWGGVDLSFWRTSIEEHGWDIDPESINFEKEDVFGSRYHVFMRKNISRLDALIQ